MPTTDEPKATGRRLPKKPGTPHRPPAPGSSKKSAAGKATGRKKRPREPSFGSLIIAALDDVIESLERGGIQALEDEFTTRRVRVGFPAPDLTPADVADTRTALGLSQAAFAAFLGVAPGSVRAWEDGRTPLPGIATRFLAEVRADPAYWKARVAAAG